MNLRVGLIGRNIAYSRSPSIFQSIGELIERQVDCAVFDISSDILPSILEQLRKSDLLGCSVTIPYKTEIIPLLDSLDPCAERLQSVNSIQIRNGALIGYNTDYVGFNSLLSFKEKRLRGRSLVLGAGGASRAVVAALHDCDLNTTVSCRRRSQFDELNLLFAHASSLPVFRQWQETVSTDEFSVIVNTTPLGGANHPDAFCPIKFSSVAGSYYDLNYNSGNQWLLAAKDADWSAFDGSRMLVCQAVRSFEIWSGISVDTDYIYAKVFGRK